MSVFQLALKDILFITILVQTVDLSKAFADDKLDVDQKVEIILEREDHRI